MINLKKTVGQSNNVSKHTASNLSASIVPLIIALLTIPLYLSYIGEERFGVLAIILAFLNYFSFMDIGLGRAASRRIAQLHQASSAERSDVLWTTILSSVTLGIIAGILLWFGVNYLLGSKIELTHSVKVEAQKASLYLALSFPLLLPVSALLGALHAKYHFRQANMVLVASNSLSQLLPLLVAGLGLIDVSWLVLTTLAVKVCASLILLVLCSKLVPLKSKPSFNLGELFAMAKYGGWVSLIGMFSPFLTTIDRVVIAWFSGAVSLTYYVIPYDLVTKIMVLPGSLSSALFPRLVSAQTKDVDEISVNGTRFLMSLMTPIVIISMALVGSFVELWVGPSISDRAKYIPEVLLLGLWANALVIPTYSKHLARRNPRSIVLVFLVEIPIYLSALILGLVQFGILGAAFAWTFRVLMDTCIILKINSMLRVIILDNLVSCILILLASITLMYIDSFIVSLWVSMALALCSFWTDRNVLTSFYKKLLE
jgi:O-antigen/teichoic acid export membrane protein